VNSKRTGGPLFCGSTKPYLSLTFGLKNATIIEGSNAEASAYNKKGKMKKILIVDDELSVRLGIKGFLEAHGHQVLEAHDGRPGLEMVEDHTGVDLIITDLQMPEVNGLEVLENTQGHSAKRWLLTGDLDAETAEKARNFGAEEVLHKTEIFGALKKHGYAVKQQLAA
jgi:CheY-like chemotaxis protein